MANVLFTRTATPSEKPITDGQLIFDTSGNGKMYLDNGTERLVMGGALTVDTTLSKTSTNPIQNKGVAGVMLDNLEDISNVTSKGFLTDALATKKLTESLTNENGEVFRFAYQDGKRGMWIKEADTDVFVPFNQLKSQTKSLSYTTVYGSINSASLTFDELQEIKGISSISSESSWIQVNSIKSMTINENTIMLNFVATDSGRNIVYDITAIGI